MNNPFTVIRPSWKIEQLDDKWALKTTQVYLFGFLIFKFRRLEIIR